MSKHFILITGITLFFLIITFYRHRLNAGTLWIFFGAWVIPVWLCQFSSLPYNKEWEWVTVFSSIAVMVGLYGGYFSSILLQKKHYPNRSSLTNIYKLSLACTIIQLISIISLLLMFYLLGSAPLLSDSILENRKLIQEINPTLWSVTQFSFISSSISAILYQYNHWNRLNKGLYFILFLLISLTGWRNFALMYALYFLLPFIFIKTIGMRKIFLFIFVTFCSFTLIAFFRGDLGDHFDPFAAVSLIAFYVYPNFINFEKLVLVEGGTNHVYTLQFLFKPIFQMLEFETTPPQTAIDAFNVATGLNPLYQDGGILNIFFTMFVIGFFIQRLEINSDHSVLRSFWRSTFLLTVVFLHNGWMLLNFMPTYNTLAFIGLLALISILPMSKSGNEGRLGFKVGLGNR